MPLKDEGSTSATDTPRTDALQGVPMTRFDSNQFSRILERENAKLREAIETGLRRLKHTDPVWAVSAATSVLESALKP